MLNVNFKNFVKHITKGDKNDDFNIYKVSSFSSSLDNKNNKYRKNLSCSSQHFHHFSSLLYKTCFSHFFKQATLKY